MAINDVTIEKIKEAIKKGHRYMMFFFENGEKWLEYVELFNGEPFVIIPHEKKKRLSLEGVIDIQYE